MDYLPNPNDEEAWRQYSKCCAVAALVALVILAAIFFFARL
jgi:hypothetical protein